MGSYCMTPGELQLDEARRWLAVARKDLNAARMLLSAEPALSAFHSQQAAEKAVKALLASRNVAFRKTHDITELGHQCAALEPPLDPILQQAADLTEYAVVFRYLDAPREPDEQEAREALDVAQQLFDAISSLTSQTPPS